ncbi:MAG: spore cortex biosynthesis protein YabQ [Clostridiales bacterium]|jgi:spore cortex biosynthesis protein YabQ|nr:spore cortex biosynthesis protein YabQ [Clostridiales bacterium]
MILSGILSRFIYDFIRAMRRIFNFNLIVINIQDFFYWLINSIFVFYILFTKNYGEVRAFNVVGFFFGMLIYSIFLSQITTIFLTNIIAASINFFLIPIRSIVLLSRKLKKNIKKHIKPSKIYLNKVKRYARLRKNKLVNNIKIIFRKI